MERTRHGAMTAYMERTTANWKELGYVRRKPVSWLWPGRVPLGKITLLVGDPGRGKSLLALDMAARITRGAPWPDQQQPVSSSEFPVSRSERGANAPQLETRNAERETPNPVGSVILLSAEDDAADTLVPRLEAAGGDPGKVVLLASVTRWEGGGETPFSLASDLGILARRIGELGDVRLVIFDPLSAYLGGSESYNNADVRRLLAPVQGLAEGMGVAVLGINHLTKRTRASIVYRSMGSLAFASAARAVWAAVPDPAAKRSPEAAGRMLLAPAKCNLAPGATGLAYRIVPHPADPAVPIVAWEPEPVAMTADEAAETLPNPTPREEAAEWLRQALAGAPLPTSQIERQGREAGFALPTLRRAKTAIGIVSYRDGAIWMLRLPGVRTAAPLVSVEVPSDRA